jgi:predicted ATPase
MRSGRCGGGAVVGEAQNRPFQLSFNSSLKVDFQGARVTSDGGLILVRELDERLGLGELMERHLSDSRSTDHGFPLWLGWGRITKGRALAERGKLEEGIDLIYEGLGVLQSSESELQLTFCLALLAQTQGELALTPQGLATLDDALTSVCQTEERYYEPELHRLIGEPLLKSGDTAEARTCFEQAIEVAREQKAKSWELRATTSLARMLANHDQRAEARSMLAEIHRWFTEGFDTADLKEAKALLEELGGNGAPPA